MTIKWPTSFPDANLIENVFKIKLKLKGNRVFTLKQLSSKFRTIWKSLPREYAKSRRKHAKSVPRYNS